MQNESIVVHSSMNMTSNVGLITFEIINKEYDFEKLTLSYYMNKFLEV
jgi:hypothetical protein